MPDYARSDKFSNEDTSATLKDMCDAVKPKNWK